MTLKQNLAEQLKAQSDIWRAQAKDYQERLEQAGEQARGEYKKAMEQMEAKIRMQQSLPSRSAAPTKRRGRIWSPPARRHLPSFSGAGRKRCPGFSDPGPRTRTKAAHVRRPSMIARVIPGNAQQSLADQK